jgi:hypothetical protein
VKKEKLVSGDDGALDDPINVYYCAAMQGAQNNAWWSVRARRA